MCFHDGKPGSCLSRPDRSCANATPAKLTRAAEPMQYASGYTLDLYCDHLSPGGGRDGVHGYDEFPHQFTGETFAECARQARRRGWAIHKEDRTATCPKCNRSCWAASRAGRGACRHGHSLSSHDVCPRCERES